METHELTPNENGNSSLYDRHAVEQMQRRGIRLLLTFEFLKQYAISQRAPGNAIRFYMAKNSVEWALRDGRITPQDADKLIHCVYVYWVEAHLIKTVYKQEKGFRGIRNTQRGKSNRKS